MKSQLQRGFTIVEILITIIVIGILVAITVVSYNASQKRAQDTKTIATISSLATALDGFYTKNGYYPYKLNVYPGYTFMTDDACIGGKDVYIECGIYKQSIACDGPSSLPPSTTVALRSDPYLNTALVGHINTVVPDMKHPEATRGFKYTADINGETCTIDAQTVYTGPTYKPLCSIVTRADGIPYQYVGMDCEPAKAYMIMYELGQSDGDCSIPGAVNMTTYYREIYGDIYNSPGTSCQLMKGAVTVNNV